MSLNPISTSTPASQLNVNPCAIATQKMDILDRLVRTEFEKMQKAYASSTLTTICGVEIIRQPVNVAAFLTAFKISQVAFDGLFHYSSDGMTCTVEFHGETLATATGSGKVEAKKNAEAALLKGICQHPLYFEKFLIELPSENSSSPASAVGRFLKSHGLYKEGDEFQTVVEMIHNSITGEFIKYSQELQFKGKRLQIGYGLKKPAALINAGQLVLKTFISEVQRPKEMYFRNSGLFVIRFFQTIPFVNALIPIILEYAGEISSVNHDLPIPKIEKA